MENVMSKHDTISKLLSTLTDILLSKNDSVYVVGYLESLASFIALGLTKKQQEALIETLVHRISLKGEN